MPKKKKITGAQTASAAQGACPVRIKQSSMPYYALRDSLAIARALCYELGGAPSAPADICPKVKLSPTSSRWRDRLGASNADGLTTGLWNAKTIALTPLGRRLVAPRDEAEAAAAAREAAMLPEFISNLYTQHDGKLLPESTAVERLMIRWGLPRERAARAFDIVKANGELGGLLREENGAFRVVLTQTQTAAEPAASAVKPEMPAAPAVPEPSEAAGREPSFTLPPVGSSSASRVFLSCGKNAALLDSLRTLLEFGSFEPVLPPETDCDSETLFMSMRECGAAVLCVDDAAITAATARACTLLQLGAAVALCGSRTILLCPKCTPLPAALRGLHRCEYTGGRLDYDATMTLLKIFNGFKTAAQPDSA